jgi:hypothetical protein
MINFSRSGPSPGELLTHLQEIDPEFMRQAEERGSFVRLPDVKKLGTLLRPSPRGRPQRLAETPVPVPGRLPAGGGPDRCR